MKNIFFYLLFTATLFAQYTKKDFKLVETTATREFNRETVNKYIISKNSRQVIAGLLSVANSLDTAFIDDIIKIDFVKYGEHICFALGQIGNSDKSAEFIYDKLTSGLYLQHNHEMYEALGKLANENIANNVFAKVSDKTIKDNDGISIFIFNLFTRRVNIDRNIIKPILLGELKSKKDMRRLEALFTIARLGGLKEAEKDCIAILNSKDKINSSRIKSFALGCFTRLKYFPNNGKLFLTVARHTDWRVRTEAAKAISYSNFTSKTQLNNYYKLLADSNVNVSRQAAISIKNIKLDEKLGPVLNNLMETSFNKSKMNVVTKGELFISYCSLNPGHILEAVKKHQNSIAAKYIYETLRNQSIPPQEVFNFLSGKLNKNEKDIFNLIPSLLSLQKKLIDDSGYKIKISELLNSKYASVVSSVAEELDSAYVTKNKEDLKKIVLSQIKEHLNDTQYYETILALYGISENIGKDFSSELLNIMKGTNQFAIKQFINQKLGIVEKIKKDFSNLKFLWKNAFTYTSAVVKTNKGEFTIKLSPDFSPISVGNFVSLVKRGFYNGVVFHRVVPDFVAQTGDSTGTGFGGPGYDIVSEFSTRPFLTNYVGMASAGRDTEGSQWYVMHNIALHLNGRYSNFGKVTKGEKVIPNINQGDKIISIQLVN